MLKTSNIVHVLFYAFFICECFSIDYRNQSPFNNDAINHLFIDDAQRVESEERQISNQSCPPGLIDNGSGCKLIEQSNPVKNCNSYCSTNTLSCSISNYQALCKCKQGYYGLTCEIATANVKSEALRLYELVRISTATIMDENELSAIVTLQSLVKTNPDLANDITINSQDSQDIKTKLTKTTKYSKAMSQFIDVIFTILKLQLKKVVTPRITQGEEILESNGQTEDKIAMINEISTAFNSYIRSSYIYNNDKNCFVEENVDFFCSSFIQLSGTYEDYKNTAIKNKRGIIDLSNASINTNYMVIQREISEELNKLITNDNTASSRIEYSIGEIIASSSSIIYKYPLTTSVNLEHITYWAANDIDVFNPEDAAFTDPCYINGRTQFDLVPLYRLSLYQNQTLITSDTKSKYLKVDPVNNYILLSSSSSLPMSYTLKSGRLPTVGFKKYNIPLYCIETIKKIHTNIAFWLFLMMTIVFLFIAIIFGSLRHCRVIKMIQMETYQNVVELEIKDDDISFGNNSKKQFKKIKENNEMDIPTRGMDISYTQNERKNQSNDDAYDHNQIYQNYPGQESFCFLFYRNMLKLHPLTCLCQENILNPFLLKFCLFTFNLFCQYGFLAIYYFDHVIDYMRTRDDRYNFIYAVKYDYDKIVYAILTSIGFNLVLKLLVLVTWEDKNRFVDRLDNAQDEEEKYNISAQFNSMMLLRRLFAGFIMLGMYLFFFVYCIGFCGIFINTQYVWFYSCLWIMFFNWLMFIPFTIMLLSAIEMSINCRDCTYYFKQLFIF